jgi:hypothetical protein
VTLLLLHWLGLADPLLLGLPDTLRVARGEELPDRVRLLL